MPNFTKKEIKKTFIMRTITFVIGCFFIVYGAYLIKPSLVAIAFGSSIIFFVIHNAISVLIEQIYELKK
ncbi:hypothetical protein C0583_06910 [Candidatus Parcubacteria bacterium]|nr:MAG: hypothetical protein C0583_06910 [Candidatus Parcubacteria bacterium]